MKVVVLCLILSVFHTSMYCISIKNLLHTVYYPISCCPDFRKVNLSWIVQLYKWQMHWISLDLNYIRFSHKLAYLHTDEGTVDSHTWHLAMHGNTRWKQILFRLELPQQKAILRQGESQPLCVHHWFSIIGLFFLPDIGVSRVEKSRELCNENVTFKLYLALPNRNNVFFPLHIVVYI